MAETEQYKGFTITVDFEMEPQNPRTEDCNLGRMICFHDNYNIGDNHMLSTNIDDYDSWADVRQKIEKYYGTVCILPVYAYEHGGIALNVKREYPFDCQWDSSMVGFIFCNREDVTKYYGHATIDAEMLKTIENKLINEVAILSAYFQGMVYEYRIERIKATCDENDYPLFTGGYYDSKECFYAAQCMIDEIVLEDDEIVYGMTNPIQLLAFMGSDE